MFFELRTAKRTQAIWADEMKNEVKAVLHQKWACVQRLNPTEVQS